VVQTFVELFDQMGTKDNFGPWWGDIKFRG
jgi:hypothetical protein